MLGTIKCVKLEGPISMPVCEILRKVQFAGEKTLSNSGKDRCQNKSLMDALGPLKLNMSCMLILNHQWSM